LQCDNGEILQLLTSTSRHRWHCVALGWPIAATIHCGCLCGYQTKSLEVPALESKKLRADLYQGLQDAIAASDTSAHAIGQRIILPSSFTVGPRHMVQNALEGFGVDYIL
jgi:hypothetical protein